MDDAPAIMVRDQPNASIKDGIKTPQAMKLPTPIP